MRYFLLFCLLSFGLSISAQETAEALELDTVLRVSLSAKAPISFVYQAQAGETISISASAIDNSENTPDAVLWVLNSQSQLIAYNDNWGDSPNPRIENLLLPEAGLYTVHLDSFNGVSEGEVDLVIEAANRFDLEIEETETTIYISANLPSSQVLRYSFNALAGDNIRITAQDLSGNLDPYLRLLNSSGELIAENDDHASFDFSLNLFDSRILSEISADDSYTLELIDFLGRSGQVSILIETLN